MALVRVYCGVATTEPRELPGDADAPLTAVLIDDAGRTLDVCAVEDHPRGYARLSSLLAERANGPYTVAVAVDNDQRLVPRLLAAAGWALSFADGATTYDYAERFADPHNDGDTPPATRRALGLARGLHAGLLAATTLPAPAEFADLKPVLAADGALANGRYGAATALREVLRELYPAALRAYQDPSEPVALAVLDALPGPATPAYARGRDSTFDTVTTRLVEEGVADRGTVTDAVTALRVASAETPRRNGTRTFAGSVSDAVRQAVAAVRACDAARQSLVDTLVQRVEGAATAAPEVPPAPAPQHASAPAPAPAPAPEPAPAPRPAPAPAAAANSRMGRRDGGWNDRPVSSPPPPPGITPIPESARTRMASSPPRRAAQPPDGGEGPPADRPGDSDVRVPTPRPAPEGPPPGGRANWPTSPPRDDWAATPPGTGKAPTPPPAAHEPLPTRGGPPSHPGWSPPPEQPAPTGSPSSVTPPWRADDLQAPEPPPLRLVEPTLPEELREDLNAWGPPDRSSPPASPEGPALRLVESGGAPRSAPPVGTDEGDDELLIFAQARSAWFSGDSGAEEWQSAMDAGWRAAERATNPEVDDHTQSGLPRRVPHANLVPGSPPREEERPLRVVRDPSSIAAHASGYFSGWRRGQEVGGYPLGNRTSRQAAGAWEFARDDRLSG